MVSKHYLIRTEAHSTRRHCTIWYYKPQQKPLATEIIDPTLEASRVVLLNGYAIPIHCLLYVLYTYAYVSRLVPSSHLPIFTRHSFLPLKEASGVLQPGCMVEVLGKYNTYHLPFNSCWNHTGQVRSTWCGFGPLCESGVKCFHGFDLGWGC